MVWKIKSKLLSYLMTFVMFINIVLPGFIPLQVFAEDRSSEVTQTISVDAEKEDWESIDPMAPTTEDDGDELLGNLYLHNDEEFLYFWIDSKNIPDWGENGQYIDLAFQLNDEDTENDKNPWNSQFNYSGMENKPQYHLSLRIKNNKEIEWFTFYEVSTNEFKELFDLNSETTAEFHFNREAGFEGKIPLEFMHLENKDQLKAHVTLSGNSDQHGAFDVIPKVEENAREYSTEDKDDQDIQSTYTEPYLVTILDSKEESTELTELEELIVSAKEYLKQENKYSKESITGLKNTLQEVQSVVDSIETKTDLEQTLETLQSAINQLELLDDVEEDLSGTLEDIEEGYFRVHFESLPTKDPEEVGLWLWGDVAEPSGDNQDFSDPDIRFSQATKTDFGYAIDFPLAETPQEIGLLLNWDQGNAQTDDVVIQILSPEMNEAWITNDFEIFLYEPLAEENVIRINYLKETNDYENWSIWTWDDVAAPTDNWPTGSHAFDGVGQYGGYANIDLALNPSKIGFLFLTKSGNEQTDDLAFDDMKHSQVFVREGDSTVYSNPYYVGETRIVGAEIVSDTELEVTFNTTEQLTEDSLIDSLTLLDPNGKPVTGYELNIAHDRNVVTLKGKFDFETGTYHVQYNHLEIPVTVGWRLTDSLYEYDGDLGLDLHEDGTATLKVWSPSAEAVGIVLYDKNNQNKVIKENIPMSKLEEAPGVWQVDLDENTTGLKDLTGYFYHLEIERDGETVLALDPYARSMAAWNNQGEDDIGKAAIVHPNQIGPKLSYADIDGFEKREDAIIYEIHTRDFTSDPNISEELDSQFGTFSAFVEKLDYIQELGVTHIQLLPVMSYYFADEFNNSERLLDYASENTNYNWGYDPQNYFSLTGMYSENPEDPEKRIEEFKNLIAEIHKRGMGVILDVVYNHTARTEIFEDLEPNYYHFMNADGTPRESFGGGRLGTTHAMSRKILVDSITYWTEEYKVDGFRFDMMGDHDAETIQIAYDEASALNPNILMIGEGWETYEGDEGDSVQPADQQWMKDTDAVGSFSDEFRNELKSGFGSEGEPRFLTGGARNIRQIYDNLTANPHNFEADDPGDVVPYIAAHDNLTLHDVIAQSIKKDPKDHQQEIHERIRLGNLMVLTSQGTPFIHAGQEYGRTKQFKHEDYIGTVNEAPYKSTYMMDENGEPFEYPYFIHDSYDSSDIINRFDWEKATNTKEYPINTQTKDYTEGLIKLRRSTDAFSKGTIKEIDESVSLVNVPEISAQDLAIIYRAEDSSKGVYYVVINADQEERTFTLNVDLKDGEVLVDKAQAGTTEIASPEGLKIDTNKVTIEPLTATIIYLDEEVEVPVDPKEPVKSAIVNDDGTVTFNYRGDLSTTEVYVPGSFNQWDEKGLPMEYEGENIWSITTPIQSGVHEYKFIVNGEWVNDPGNSTILDNGNNQVIVPGLVFDTENEVVKGESLSLSAQWVATDGTTSPVDASYELDEEIDGVTLTNNILSVAESVLGDTEITVIATYEGYEVAQTIRVLDEVQKQRIIELTYIRENEDYDDWNLWVWGTGVQDDEIQFDEITDKGAVARIAIGPETSQIGFVIRKGQDWNEKDPYGEDRFIQANPNELITKVTVYEGVGEIDTVPTVDGPTFEDGNVTFYYRDPELYLSSEMDTIDQVQLRLEKDGEEYGIYDMEYDEKNEYFFYIVEGIKEGYYEYTYLVTRNGETIEVSDPYNTVDGKSSFTYSIPKITAETSVYPEAISYHENAVVTIEPEIEEGVELSHAFIDLTPVGGPEEVAIDLELLEHTIAVEQSTTAGTKTLDIVLVDEFGNKHYTDVELEVKTRQIEDEAEFDWDEARIYFMLTDRFANGDPSNDDPHGVGYDINHPESYHGGDFQGIIDHLDYLDELGINTIWITPIVDNIDWDVREGKEGSQYGYHGYWAQDFTKIDEHLGDVETLKELINQAHDRGIKIMVDVVLNHAGYGMKESDSGEGIPLYPTDEVKMNFAGMLRENPVEGDEVLGELSGLPDFRTEDPEVRNQLIEWQTAWLDHARTDRGDTIDYFRVDTVKHVDDTTWHGFKNELTKIKPDFKMIGEYYGASINNTGGYLSSGQMDSLLDFDFKNQAASFIQGDIEGVEATLSERNTRINNTATLGQFLSSHDEDGFLITHADGDEGKFKVAAALQMTAKGQPVIYYGEEIGLSGKNAGDMDNQEFSENRYDFDWDRVEDNDMLEHYQKLLNIRAEYSNVFSKGSRQHLAGTNDNGYSIFVREYGKQSMIVGLNTNVEELESSFKVKYKAGTEVTDLYNEVTYTVSDDQTLTVDLPGNEKGGTVILVADIQEDSNDPGDSNETGDSNGSSDTDGSNNTGGSDETNRPGKPTESDDSGQDETTTGDENEDDDSKELEKPTKTNDTEEDDDGKLPQTGETSNLSLYVISFIFMSGGLFIVIKFRKEETE